MLIYTELPSNTLISFTILSLYIFAFIPEQQQQQNSN